MGLTKIVGILLLLFSLPFGVTWVAISSVGAMVFQAISVAIISKKYVQYCFREQIEDWFAGLSPAILIVLCTWWLQWISLSPIITLIIQTFLTIVVFFVCGKVSKSEAFELFYSFILKQICH